MSADPFLRANWPAPPTVQTLITTRQGGTSLAPWDSFNLGLHVGDQAEQVLANRALLRQQLPAEPTWLTQTHSTIVVDATAAYTSPPEADASFSTQAKAVCVVMTADCLPILLCNQQGSFVAALHAGWRGLCHGVIEATVQAYQGRAGELMAYLGPAIGPEAFEVGPEVREAFIKQQAQASVAFSAIGEGKYLADIYQLARLRLGALGVTQVYGGDFCTVIERERFYSYRRDGITGRMASLIWLHP